METQQIRLDDIVRTATFAGLIAGTVDIGAAALINLIPPTVILQAIASGLLGLAAYKVHWTIALGFVLQIAMSIVIAAIYAVAATKISLLIRRPLLAGLVYGAIIFFVMNMIVVPLSRFAPRPAHVTLAWIVMNFAAMLLFGLIVAVTASRAFAPRLTSEALAG